MPTRLAAFSVASPFASSNAGGSGPLCASPLVVRASGPRVKRESRQQPAREIHSAISFVPSQQTGVSGAQHGRDFVAVVGGDTERGRLRSPPWLAPLLKRDSRRASLGVSSVQSPNSASAHPGQYVAPRARPHRRRRPPRRPAAHASPRRARPTRRRTRRTSAAAARVPSVSRPRPCPAPTGGRRRQGAYPHPAAASESPHRPLRPDWNACRGFDVGRVLSRPWR